MRRISLLVVVAAVVCGCSGRTTRKTEKLLADLDSDSPRRRARAERNLAEHGRAAIKPLSAIVTGEDVEKYELSGDWEQMRLPAAKALGLMAAKASLARSEAESAAKPLLKALKQTKNRPLRLAAAKALGGFTQLGTPINDLILLFREDDEELVETARESLVSNALHAVYRLVLTDEPAAAAVKRDWARLVERLGSSDDDIRLDTAREMAASDDPRAAALLLRLLAGDKSGDVRYTALRYCQGLAEAKPQGEVARKLAELLPTAFAKDSDSRVVLVAAQMLRERQAELVGTFLQRLGRARELCEKRLMADAASSGYDAATRSDAINALARAASQERDDLLAKLVDVDEGEAARIRRAAASVLASSESAVAPKALRKAMEDPDSIVKLVAAQALGRRGDTDAVKYLVELLSHKEAKIRTPAADALGTLGAKALDVLEKELRDSLARARELAQWEVLLLELQREKGLSAEQKAKVDGLAKAIADYRAKSPGRDEKHIAWGLVTGLGSIAADVGDEAAPALDAVVAAARCHYVDVRRAAANALASFGGEKAIGTLVAALRDPDEAVRWYAAAALEAQGDAAVPALVAALGDERTVGLAARSLSRVGGADALRPVVERLAGASGSARADLVWSVGELLGRHPASPHAAAAREALRRASQLADDPEAARLATYALAKTRPKPLAPK